MKNLVLFIFIALIVPSAFSQAEQAPQNLNLVQGIQLDGKFSFTFQQNEYYVLLSQSNGTYEELDSQGTVIGHGAFNHADISTITPETTDPNGIISTDMRFKVLSKTETSITIEVTAKNGDTGVFELHKV